MISTAIVAQCLDGIDFPVTKDEVIEYAEERNAPPDVLDALQDMPEPADGQFYSIASIWNAVGARA